MRVDGAQRGADLGAGEHAAGELDRDLRLERHLAAGGGHRPAAPIDAGLEAEQVELGLDEQQVDAALEQPAALLLVGVAQVGEADLPERCELRARPDGPGDVAAVAARDLVERAARP